MLKLYEKLLADERIKSKYDEIQRVDTTSYYHGYNHIINVIKMLKKFVALFNIPEHEEDKLLVAIIFHDIGRSEVGKGHELKSANYMVKFLKKFDLKKFEYTEDDLIQIYESIVLHEQKDNLDELNNFQLLVNFVDKLDITKERVNLGNPLDQKLPSYKYDMLREIYLDVNEVEPIIEDESLILEFDGNENLSLERLYSIPFMQVVDKLHKEFSSRYNLEAKVRIKTHVLNKIIK